MKRRLVTPSSVLNTFPQLPRYQFSIYHSYSKNLFANETMEHPKNINHLLTPKNLHLL